MRFHPIHRDLVREDEMRVAQMRRDIHGSHPRRDFRRRAAMAGSEHPVRRWVGRQLVRAGERLAADPSLRPARSL